MHYIPGVVNLGTAFTASSLALIWWQTIAPFIIERAVTQSQREILVVFESDNTCNEVHIIYRGIYI